MPYWKYGGYFATPCISLCKGDTDVGTQSVDSPFTYNNLELLTGLAEHVTDLHVRRALFHYSSFKMKHNLTNSNSDQSIYNKQQPYFVI